ncbi:MAG: GTPase domain-containing protein [Deferrisomatales bacterium]|nr:GTPase domain-containing protein [Deferrisomatales bacterium]
MAMFNYAAREMTAKIVYYGPGLSGKTSSIQHIHGRVSPKSKGKLVSLATETDRTLFFDFFPVEFGQIGGFKVKFNFYTVPGQVFYNTTRKLVLKGADGVVFVADSQPGMMEQNLESLENLRSNLEAHGIDWETVPFVLQYNKRDLPGALPVEEMRARLNPRRVLEFETSATTGVGIMEAMKAVCKLVLEDVQQKQRHGAAHTRPEAARAPASRPGGEIPMPAGTPERRREGVAEKAAAVRVPGTGSVAFTLTLPVRLKIPAGLEGTDLQVQLRVRNRSGGEVALGDLSAELSRKTGDAGRSEPQPGPPREPAPEPRPQPAPEPKPQKGFLSRLFGR